MVVSMHVVGLRCCVHVVEDDMAVRAQCIVGTLSCCYLYQCVQSSCLGMWDEAPCRQSCW